MGKLLNKNAIVTSGGQGIGKEIAFELIRQGCNVAVSYYSSREGADEVISFARENNRRAEAFKADVTCEQDCVDLVKNSVSYLGGLDILVNNAGSLVKRCWLEDMTTEFWNNIFNINMTSMMVITREAVPHLSKAADGASIVNLSSLAGRKGGHAGSLAYGTAKGAVLTWTRALAAELGPMGIRVNALAPGLILGTSFHSTHTTPESAKQTISQIPIGRAGNPSDIARAATYFASEYDGFISGATLDINGGVYCA